MSAEQDASAVRTTETLTITVLRARHLRGNRGDVVTSMVKAEYNERNLGESTKVECSPEAPAEYNFNATYNITFDNYEILDEMSYKPVLLTVIEVLPKEKKQKEEKTVVLGQCTVDLLPMVKGETKHRSTLVIHPVPGSVLENLPADSPKPELDIQLSVNEPLLSEQQLNDANLASITVESLFSPPEAFQLTGQQYLYTACTPLPVGAEKETLIVFPTGTLKPGVEKEPHNKQLKWMAPGSAQGQAAYISDSFVAQDAIEDEAGDFRTKEEREHRAVAEHEKNRVLWNTVRRSYLPPDACKTLQDKIAKTRYWPVEVMRMPLPSGNKGKKRKPDHLDEDNAVFFHGVAYVNMAPLLYPGVKRIRGAYKVYPFIESENFEKTKRKGNLSEEAAKVAAGLMMRNTASPFPKGGGKGGKEKDDKKETAKKGKTPKPTAESSAPSEEPASALIKPTDPGAEVEAPPVNVEGQQYAEHKSYIMIEICLHRPLVPKRPPEELAKRVAEYIPPRPLFPKRTNGAQKAVEDYHNQVVSVANLVLEEFREMYGDEFSKGELVLTAEAIETRRQKLIYELNTSGKYFAFKEQLKHAVVKIVREKYLKTSNFDNKDELQAFLSELYVYLIDQMHVGLGKVLSLEDKTPIPEPITDSAQLKHFAREAEVNENFELAAKYYQERIARSKNEPAHWLDYGTFCLYINDISKTEECFRECISIDQSNLEGLMLYAVVCAMEERSETAETFFEAATCVNPRSILAWTMLGLFYYGIDNEISTEMAFIEANKLNVAAAKNAMKQEEDTTEKEVISPEVNNNREAEESQSKPGMATPSSDKGSVSNKTSGKTSDKKNSKKVGMGGRTTSSESVNSASKQRPGSRTRSPVAPVAPPPEAEPAADEPPPREPTPVPAKSIFMQAVDWLLEVKAMAFTERALALELLSLKNGPGADYYIALSRLRLQKKELQKAEESLNEALQFEHQNPDAWSLMGHVKYLLGDTHNAKQCYEHTLALIADAQETHSIYLRLASIYLQDQQFQDAKNTFLMACKRSPSCISWLGVGIACFRLGELSEAEDALSEANILNNADPEVWGYLSLVCLKTGRQLEAEQAYKYAIKVNLTNNELLDEIHRIQEEVGFGNPQF